MTPESEPHLVQLNVDVPIDLRKSLSEYCATNTVKKRVIVELALRMFFAKEAARDAE